MMPAYYISTRVTKEGEVHLPKLPFKPGQDVEVVVRPFEEDEDRREEKAWLAFGLRQFLNDDAPEDSIYDGL